MGHTFLPLVSHPRRMSASAAGAHFFTQNNSQRMFTKDLFSRSDTLALTFQNL